MLAAGIPEVDEVLLDGVGAAIAEGKVVFGGAAFVAVALDGDVGLRIFFEEVGIVAERLLSVRADVGLIKIEIGVFDFLGEEFIEGGSLDRFGWRSGNVDGDARRGIRAAAGTACGDGICGGVRRSDGGGTLHRDGTDFGRDGDVIGVGGGPGELGGLTLVDGRGIRGESDRGLRSRRRRRRRRWCGLGWFFAADNEEKRSGSENQQGSVERAARLNHACPPKTPEN